MSLSVRSTAFIDWNSQIHRFCSANQKGDPTACAEQTLDKVVRRIAQALTNLDKAARFRVTLRLYHGWHKGYEPTDRRRAMLQVVASTEFSSLSHKPNIVIDPNIQYGDCLIDALPQRLHTGRGIHLPNTWRRQEGDENRTEKMVDTALASDLLTWARHSTYNELAIVVGEDDDLIPPLFIAEAWSKPLGARAILLRAKTGGMLRLEGLLTND